MVTFIAPSFKEDFDPHVFIGSLLCQRNKNWKAIIYNNGPNPWLKHFVEETQEPKHRYELWLKSLIERFKDDRIIYRESPQNTGAWGCYNRIDALMNMVDTEYVVQTSIQDYWLPNAVDAIAANHGADFIYWNSIHHHLNYKELHAIPKVSYIDWGNFAVKTDIARKVGINHPEAFTADGFFVRDCIASGLIVKPVKLEQVLTIHN
ncbi:MAG: hypothetical protein IAE95_11135 [Chitinophagaceae bacterium]|nr:hypothetical protein [Chitinophagaceae bacterium]